MKFLADGIFTGMGTKKYIPAKITVAGRDYTCDIKRSSIHKQQAHLAKTGGLFNITRSGVVHIIKLPKITQKELDQIQKDTVETLSVFNAPN